jgi:adenine/guanine phosphoribosyltransferase-like PRPP-binding protein
VPTSGYLTNAFEKPGITLRQILHLLKGRHFDGIAVRGISGMMFGPMVALAMRKRLMVVRKHNDSTHRSQEVESLFNKQDEGKYIILDDQVSSGRTRDAILTAVEKNFPNMKCVGICTYNYGVTFRDPPPPKKD